jgi:hypothetical protein
MNIRAKLNQSRVFSATNRFQPSVRVEFMQDVLDMIIYCGAADMLNR